MGCCQDSFRVSSGVLLGYITVEGLTKRVAVVFEVFVPVCVLSFGVGLRFGLRGSNPRSFGQLHMDDTKGLP